MNLYTKLLEVAGKYSGNTAIIDGEKQYTYHELTVAAEGLAAAVAATSDKEVVGVFLPTSAAFIISTFALFRAGYGMLPFNLLAPHKDLAFAARDSGLDTVITSTMLKDKAEAFGLKVIALEELAERASKGMKPPVRPLAARKPAGKDDLAVLLYTSGTTGDPKGVRLTHGNLLSNIEDMLQIVNLKPGDSVIGILPLFHTFAITATMGAPIYTGGKFIAHTRFNPDATLRDIERYKVSMLIAVPSMFRVLTALQKAKQYDMSSLRLAITGGEPLPPVVEQQFKTVFGIEILQGYGLTETSPVVSVNRPETNRPGTAGVILPRVEVRIVDESGNDLPPNDIGEIVVAGPNVMQGYHNNPEATAAVMDGKWFYTGDMGTLDEEGYLKITGRKKEMVIVAGMNVYPAEVEGVLDEHPAVMMAAVKGFEDEARGESVKAYIVPKDPRLIGTEEAIEFAKAMAQQAAALGIATNAEAATQPQEPAAITSLDELEASLKAYANEHLSQYKRPRVYEFRASFPIGPTGKVTKKLL